MSEVVAAIKRVTDLMGEISAASSEQSQGVAQVGEAVTQMDQVTQQNAALVEEMAAAASSLNNQAQDLVNTVAFFKLSAGQAAYSGDAPQGMSVPVPLAYASSAFATPRVAKPAAFGNASGRGMSGASLGINLDTAIQAHAQWRAKLRTAVATRENLDADTVGRDDCCELGKWLHGSGNSQYGGKPSFVNLLDSHRQFHEEAGKVARLINQGAYGEAEMQLGNGTGFANASQKVSMAVVQLAKELKVRLASSAAAASSPAARPSAARSPVKSAMASPGKVTSAAGDEDWESF